MAELLDDDDYSDCHPVFTELVELTGMGDAQQWREVGFELVGSFSTMCHLTNYVHHICRLPVGSNLRKTWKRAAIVGVNRTWLR